MTTDNQSIFGRFQPLCAEAYQPGRRDTFAVGNDSGFLLRDGKKLVVAIAGSNDIADWGFNGSGNGRISTVNLSGGMQAHAGFLEAARQIATVIGDEILCFCERSESACVIFTGHSRGGAIGQLLPVVLGLQPHQYRVVTFGSPHCFSGSKHQGQPVDRPGTPAPQAIHFRNWSDVVPLFPLALHFGRYHTIGTVVRRSLTGVVTSTAARPAGRLRSLWQAAIAGGIAGVAFGGRLSGFLPHSLVKGVARFLRTSHGLDHGYSHNHWWGNA